MYLSNKNIKQVVFEYILPIYFVILYNTMGMSHLKVKKQKGMAKMSFIF